MKSQHTLTDTYTRITNFVIEQLERGQIIWRQGWNTLGLPKNIVSGRTYKGWNCFLLNFVTKFYQYKIPYFLTYKQALDMGGTIRRGQKGYNVVWWASVDRKEDAVEGAEPTNRVLYRVPKIHTVFNIEQTHGIEFPKTEELFRSHRAKIAACENIITGMPNTPKIMHGGDDAFYEPTKDYIQIPVVEQFVSDEYYYETLFHELAHSTGHSSRLNRKELVESDGFGKELYSKEELTAELTAAFLCAISGIEQQTISNSAAYIQSWLAVLKNDKRLILKAATQAQAASDYILNTSKEEQRLPVTEEITA
ncbi:MAG: DUF1738 domain-containing protein [Bacteroidetes bacterium]|nr:DUF1738 domain-containing protein [Bacteroidota bacterium]